ncbi:hypothetical protein [Natronococcus amylolyticus]|uniref:hypothetical protein n=1 Tax=Natronococcus amylolyticus TaxID=44470 RepID=UPI001267C40C|nr:hypothetical protein [Natronococcus amylolyticus]
MRPTRRALLCAGGIAVCAGCAAESEEDVDNGVVLEEDSIEATCEESVDLAEGQTVTAAISGLNDGDRVLFTVGDGTGFVHREHIYEDGTDEYEVEESGQHSIQTIPERHESPMNEDVIVDVEIDISDP